MEELLSELKNIRKDIDFENETGLIANGLLASAEIIQIVAMIEEVFSIKIPVSKLRPTNFDSAEQMWNLIQELQDED